MIASVSKTKEILAKYELQAKKKVQHEKNTN